MSMTAPPSSAHDKDIPMVTTKAWSREKKLAFATLKPAALCIIATDGPVSVKVWDGAGGVVRTYGGNSNGVWPARIARSAAWSDKINDGYRNPFFYLGTQIRLWAGDVASRDRLAEACAEMIAIRAEEFGTLGKLEEEFADLGAELDMALFEMDIVGVAERLGIATWDDYGLSGYLDRVVARAQSMSRNGQVSARLLEIVMCGIGGRVA